MSNQDLINYQVSIEVANNASIDQLTQQNADLHQSTLQLYDQITQIQDQISTNNNQITILQQDNTFLDETIAYLPTDGSATDLISYQQSLQDGNNLRIDQINQQNAELNLSILQIRNQINQTGTQITNNNNKISILQQDNAWIEQTITYIPSNINNN